MRTNIDLDSEFVSEAFRYAQVSTKKELANLALKEVVETRRLDVRELRGKVRIAKDFNYKRLRSGAG